MNLLQTLNSENLKKIAQYFDLNEYNNQDILLEQLEYLKDVRNYLSHNFKVLTISSIYKSNNNFYQQKLDDKIAHHYLHMLIDRYSSKNQLLKNFTKEYQELFQNYQINFIHYY